MSLIVADTSYKQNLQYHKLSWKINQYSESCKTMNDSSFTAIYANLPSSGMSRNAPPKGGDIPKDGCEEGHSFSTLKRQQQSQVTNYNALAWETTQHPSFKSNIVYVQLKTLSNSRNFRLHTKKRRWCHDHMKQFSVCKRNKMMSHIHEIDQSTCTGTFNKSETFKSNMRKTRFKN